MKRSHSVVSGPGATHATPILPAQFWTATAAVGLACFALLGIAPPATGSQRAPKRKPEVAFTLVDGNQTGRDRPGRRRQRGTNRMEVHGGLPPYTRRSHRWW